MPMDAVFLHGLTQELTQSLTGARIDKVQQPERDLLLLSVRTQSGNAKLLVHGGVGSARVHFTAGTFENPAEPPMFCMLLRKHLVGARITGISQPDFERMLILDLDGRDELGTPVRKQLVVEMLGRQSNVILVSGDGHIIDCMRRVDSSMSETRQVQPGLFYRMPLRQDKPVLFDTTPEQRTQVLSAPITAATVDKWLLGLFSGVSPLLCREVCFRALGDASPRLERLDDAQRARLAHRARCARRARCASSSRSKRGLASPSARKHTSRHSSGDTPEKSPSSHLSTVAAVIGAESTCVRCSGVVSNSTGLSCRSGIR